jgi:hypothetical protein
VASATFSSGALASSHREAPGIANDPCADNTDLYAFVSPDKPDTVTIIANYIPLEEPNGGPNFASFCPDVLYTIHVDNTGDAIDDLTFDFKFHNTINNPNTFNYNLGAIAQPNDSHQTVFQTYDVYMTKAGGAATKINANPIPVAPVNIGPRSFPTSSYGTVWNKAVMTGSNAITSGTDSISVFAGPADDPFFVDLGAVFDLVGIRGSTEADQNPFKLPTFSAVNTTVGGYNLGTGAYDTTTTDPNFGLSNGGVASSNVGQKGGGFDGLAGFNTHTIAIQVPFDLVHKNHAPNIANNGNALKPYDPDNVIGVWASASRKRITIRHAGGGVTNNGQWVQVSRLGLPLINELVIPLAKKDAWNNQQPATDVANYGALFLHPELAADAAVLYPTVFGAGAAFDTAKLETAYTTHERDDMLEVVGFYPTIFCSFAPDATTKANCHTTWGNQIKGADLLRLNLAVAPTTTSPNRMGVVGGDNAGFPNGRRLADDVVDILEQVVMGGVLMQQSILGVTNPNTMGAPPIGDGVDANDVPFQAAFPYVALPNQGFNRNHDGYNPTK